MRRRGGEEEQATDIKSNNPHLAGGEKMFFFTGTMRISPMKELDNHPELKFHHANWIGNLSMQIDWISQ